MRRALAVELSDADRATLRRWARGWRTLARWVLWAKTVLAAADGQEDRRIVADHGAAPTPPSAVERSRACRCFPGGRAP